MEMEGKRRDTEASPRLLLMVKLVLWRKYKKTSNEARWDGRGGEGGGLGEEPVSSYRSCLVNRGTVHNFFLVQKISQALYRYA